MAISPSTTALEALLKWHKNTNNTEKTTTTHLDLEEEEDFIYLVLTLKNIPQKGGPHKIPLPNSIYSSPQVCLIIDDRPNSKLTSKHAKEKILTDNIPVTKVIKLSKLRTDYTPFEAKRKLCDSYDMFFADKRVIPFLPKLLGKSFFKTRKLPLGVDLSHKNWKEQIERGLTFGLLSFGGGTCSVVRVARVGMEKSEIVENVNAGVKGVLGFVPNKIMGVRSFHLKFSGSVALPLYQSLPDIKLRIEGKGGKSVEDVMEIDGGTHKTKIKKAKRGRIHDVDHDGGEVIENDGSGCDDVDEEKLVGKSAKKRKRIVVDEKKRSKKGKVVNCDTGDADNDVEEVEKEEG